jgi:hypothetical protein
MNIIRAEEVLITATGILTIHLWYVWLFNSKLYSKYKKYIISGY